MEEGRLLLRQEGREAQETLLRINDGDAALLYVYLQLNPACTVEAAADALRWERARAGRARGLLLAYGLAADGALPPPRKEASYPPGELTAAREGDPAFNGLCGYLEEALGRILRKSELETLLAVYETLNLTPDVLVLLISFCREEGQLSARNLERWAYRWHDQGLTTYAAAERFLEDWRLRNDRYGRILRIFGHDRRPSDAEKAYLDDWLKRGVTPELVSAAYDEMTTAIGRFNWAYINKILLNWMTEGIRTPQQAKARDKRPAPAKKETAETAILRRMAEKRAGRERTLAARLAELRAASPEFLENERALRLAASKLARSRGDERLRAQEEHQALLTRRAGLLRAYGKDEHWLEDQPDCPLCGDRGYVGTEKCQCLLKALEQAAHPAAV